MNVSAIEYRSNDASTNCESAFESGQYVNLSLASKY